MNTMNKWTEEEKNYVLKKSRDGYTSEEIHKTGKITRSKYAIELKLYNHIYDQLQNGDTHEDMATEFKRSSSDIKEIEKKIFEMRNKSDNQTPYTNDGGYVLNAQSNTLDLSEFHNVNRTMNTVLHFYENILRLNKLKEENIIDESFYNDLIKKLNKFEFDKNKITNSITNSITNNTEHKLNTETKESSVKKDKKEKTDKKAQKKKDESSDEASIEIEIPVKKLKKRII